MKIVTCPNCNTKFEVPEDKNLLECVVCGNIWTAKNKKSKVSNPIRKKSKMICVLSAILILLFIYAFFIKPNHQNNLSINLTQLSAVPQFDGSFRLNIIGEITNTTDKTKAIPTITVKLLNETNEIIDIKEFIPPSPLIDSKQTLDFKYQVVPSDDSVVRAEVFFAEEGKND